MTIDDYAGTTPEFRPEDFLVGHLEGWGMIETILGSNQRRASIKAHGTAEPSAGITNFTEVWTFDDGQVDTLRWRIKALGDGKYSGEEPTLEGEAEGERAGCAFHWTYTRNVPDGEGGSTKLNFDDWFYRIDETGVIIRGSAGRLGIPFAHAYVTYRKL